eukprot:CAMPEP_0172689922 /NCGR_PEP_ID=MMETSP1074-20121228/23492_1 /TAXON_ID=2916 /ORGANISM="Ceratium fusus, Strain PA161109" /LENGTH=95 /DNA_ID=CAMNT_0013509805 /DNA_START=407 /DNA_END=691 /DNA_ORIENTATION=+
MMNPSSTSTIGLVNRDSCRRPRKLTTPGGKAAVNALSACDTAASTRDRTAANPLNSCDKGGLASCGRVGLALGLTFFGPAAMATRCRPSITLNCG